VENKCNRMLKYNIKKRKHKELDGGRKKQKGSYVVTLYVLYE
jgi:hypothetical protein